MNALTKQEVAALPVEFKLNGKSVVGRAEPTHRLCFVDQPVEEHVRDMHAPGPIFARQ